MRETGTTPTMPNECNGTERCITCQTTWRHSDMRGCCDQCGRLFVGLRAFDTHRHVTYCHDVSTDPRYAVDNTDPRGPQWRLIPTARQAAALERLNAARAAGREGLTPPTPTDDTPGPVNGPQTRDIASDRRHA